MKNLKIDHKKLALHFMGNNLHASNERFRQLKRKYEDSKTGLWSIYVKAYNWDTREKGMK